MKKIVWILLAVAVVPFTLSAVLPSAPDAPVAAEQQTVVRLTRYDGQRIVGVTASSAFEVTLVQSTQTKVVAEISQELENRLQLTLNDGIVNVSLGSSNDSRNLRRKWNPVMKLTVYLPELTWLKASGATEINSVGAFTADHSEISLNGASELHALNISAGILTITGSGASEADITAKAGEIKCTTTGASELDLNLQGGIGAFTCSGASEVTLSGECNEAEMTVTGSSELDAEDLQVKKLTVRSSGASSVQVWATAELNADASTASDIKYKGSPAKLTTKTSSASSIKKID